MTLPYEVSGLKAWYQSDILDGYAEGGPIAAIADSSRNGFALSNPTAAQQPSFRSNILNGLPCMLFDAVDDGLFTNSFLFNAIGQPFTVFAVYNYRGSVSAGRRCVNGSSSQASGNWLMGPYNGLYQIYAGAFAPGP